MKATVKFIRWLPRILCILAILYLSVSGTKVFDPNDTVWHVLVIFIQPIILLVFLIIAWKWEYIGGIIFIILGIGINPFFYMPNYRINHSVWLSLGNVILITLPYLFVGSLFILSHFLKKKQHTSINHSS